MMPNTPVPPSSPKQVPAPKPTPVASQGDKSLATQGANSGPQDPPSSRLPKLPKSLVQAKTLPPPLGLTESKLPVVKENKTQKVILPTPLPTLATLIDPSSEAEEDANQSLKKPKSKLPPAMPTASKVALNPPPPPPPKAAESEAALPQVKTERPSIETLLQDDDFDDRLINRLKTASTKTIEPKGEFLNPQTVPVRSDDFEELIESPNVSLEKNESLPESLEDVIWAYDDEIKHSRNQDGVRECTIHLAIARILEHAGHEKLAYVRYLKALEANSNSRSAIHELRRIARAYDKSKDVTTLLRSEIDTGIPKHEQAIFLEEYARIAQNIPDHQEEAIYCLHRAIALTPDKIAPLDVLMRRFGIEQRWEECVEVLNKIPARTTDSTVRMAHHMLNAEISHHRLNQPSLAVNKYLQALDEVPDSMGAFIMAASILIRQEHWQTAHRLFQNYAQASSNKDVAQFIWVISAAIASDRLNEPDASSASYEKAYKLQPNDTLPLELLLDNYANNLSQWQDFDKVMLRLSNASLIPKDKADIAVLRAINLSENGNAPNTAIDVLRQGLEESPQNRMLIEMYNKLLFESGRYEETAQITWQLAQQSDSEDAALRFAELGCYYLDTLHQIDEAVKCFKQALSFKPDQRIAFENLEHIYRSRGNFSEVANIYRARLSVSNDARMRASILYTLASLYDYCLNQPNDAIQSYEAYREIYPDDIHSIHNLQRLYEATQNWNKLFDVLLLEKDTSSSPIEQCSILIRMANIYIYKLQKSYYAIEILQHAKKLYPNNILLYQQLRQILTKEKKWLELINILSELVKLQTSLDDKMRSLCDMGIIYERELSDDASATNCYERVLKLDPTNTLANMRLENIYRRTKNAIGYYDLVLRQCQANTSPQKKARLLYKVALKYVTLFSNFNSAIEILESAIQLDPSYGPIGNLLSLLYVIESRYDALTPLLQNLTNQTKHQGIKCEAAINLASIYIWKQNLYQEAIHPLELALALKPEMTYARILLIFVQHWLKHDAELSALYFEAAQNVDDNELAIALYRESADRARLSAKNQSSSNPDEIASLQQILKLDPDDIIANERLEAMEPRRANLVPFLEKRLKRANGEEEIELKLSIAESIFIDNPHEAFALMCEIVDKNPAHLPALRMASNTAIRLNNPALACRFLVLEAKILNNISMSIIAWREAANIAQKQLGQIDLATYNLKQAFLLAPHRMDICDELIEILRQQQEHKEIEAILQIQVRSISKANSVIRYQQMADLYLNDLKEPAQAAVKLRQILEIEHENVDVHRQLIAVEIGLEHWNEAKSAIMAFLELPKLDPQLIAEARTNLSMLYYEKLANPKAAIPILQALLAQNPDDKNALQMLANIYLDASKYNESLSLYLRLNAVQEAPHNIGTLLQIATIYKTLGDYAKVNETMRQAASLTPLNSHVLYEIQPWIQNCNDPTIILNFVEAILALKDLPPESMVPIYAFAAFCYGGPLHMRFEADKCAITAANIAPKSLEAQLLAAKVFDPKEAMAHAYEAAKIAPYAPEPYIAMHDTATNASRFDMQARVEQALFALGETRRYTPTLQSSYKLRKPDKANSLTDDILLASTSYELNFHVLNLLRIAGQQAQIFVLPEIATESLQSYPSLVPIVEELLQVFGIQNIDIRFAQDAPFIFSNIADAPGKLVFNSSALMAGNEDEQHFHIASAFCNVKLGTMPIRHLNPDDAGRLIFGLLALADESLSSPDILSRVKAFVSRKERRAIIDYIRDKDINCFNFDPVALQHTIATIDSNIGLLCCADLDAAIAGIFRRKTPNAPIPMTAQQRIHLYPHMPNILDLFQFNVSDRMSEIRQKLDLYIKMTV